jgi:hypothetical protein
MQKATSVLLGALVLAVTVLVIWWAAPKRAVPTGPAPAVSFSAQATAASAMPDAATLELLLGEAISPLPRPGNEGTGSRLLDGAVPPSLPEDTPKSMRFGVVLVHYRGAQRAPRNARTRAEALALAEELSELAQKDFKAAVDRGDPGSAVDVGRIGINVLEPAPNQVLFSLPAGGVGGPVDTPTGYWIVRNAGK